MTTLPNTLPQPSPSPGFDLIEWAMSACRGVGNFRRSVMGDMLERLAGGDLTGFVARSTPQEQASLWSSACIAAGYMRQGDLFVARKMKAPRGKVQVKGMVGV